MINDPRDIRIPKNSLTDKSRAIELARMVIAKKNLQMSLTPTESLLMSRELLKALNIKEE